MAQSMIAVLSGIITRTGPWGAPTPRGLPQFMFPSLIVVQIRRNCKGLSQLFGTALREPHGDERSAPAQGTGRFLQDGGRMENDIF